MTDGTEKDDESESSFEEAGSPENERPTVVPPFDLATYAKNTDVAVDQGEPEATDRPTVAPPFDPATYAKQTMADPGAAASMVAGAEVRPVLEVAAPPAASVDRLPELRKIFAKRDYRGALTLAELIMEAVPGCGEARDCAESCRTFLADAYAVQLGPLHRVPTVEVGAERLRTLSLDHRTGFMLSLIDGVSSLDIILDISGMPRVDGLRILLDLVEQRIVSVGRR